MAHREGRITLFGEGEETRDHIYIDDVVAAIELVLQLRSSGLLNLASGHSVSYAELAKMVAALCSFPVEIKGSPRQNPITHRAFDVTALHRSFPTFVFTPLKDGLAKAQAVEQSGQFDRSPGGAGGHPVRGKIAKAAKRKVHADRRPDAGAETELYQG